MVTLFSFGYWGSGSATHDLVKAIDAVEAHRGFAPPLWIDIRGSRSVRAAGFRDREFEKLLGSRYAWMSDLGNRCVLEKRKGVEVINPEAAAQLLHRALADRTRRVIFFCACEYPARCHRRAVTDLVLQYAKHRKEPVEIIEWPGGEPKTYTIDVLPGAFRKIAQGHAKSIAIPSSVTLHDAVAMPWGSIATLRAGPDNVSMLIGPARFSAKGAHLRLLPDEPGTADGARAFREQFGYSRRT
jgi:hypothetical protein